MPWVNALFEGLKPAVIAIILLALHKISKKSLQSTILYIIAILSFVAVFFFNFPFPLIIVAAIVVGISITRILPHTTK